MFKPQTKTEERIELELISLLSRYFIYEFFTIQKKEESEHQSKLT